MMAGLSATEGGKSGGDHQLLTYSGALQLTPPAVSPEGVCGGQIWAPRQQVMAKVTRRKEQIWAFGLVVSDFGEFIHSAYIC